MSHKHFVTCLIWTALLLAACVPAAQPQASTPAADTTDTANMPNPASVFCEENGGTVELRSDADGSQTGYCLFTDGSECDEWAFFRGECRPGDSLEPAAVDDSGWKVYQNDRLGYSLEFPAGAELSSSVGWEDTITITGPLVDDEHWPLIFFNHPQDREEYAFEQGADLEEWLSQHNLVGEERMPDVQIAGETAVHYRHPASEQSYASDLFFFARGSQLYSISIVHGGNKEDWDLYNHFLNSIHFEE